MSRWRQTPRPIGCLEGAVSCLIAIVVALGLAAVAMVLSGLLLGER